MPNEIQFENQYNKWFKIFDSSGAEARVTFDGTLFTNTLYRIVGSSFSGSVKDPNFWNETIAGSGVITQGGKINLITGITANSSAIYQTARLARFISGVYSMNKAVIKMTTPPQINNIRRWGVFNDSNGFFFQFDGLVFSIGWLNNGVPTLINNGNFNGELSPAIVPDGLIHVYYIVYNQHSINFYYDKKLLHVLTATTNNFCNTLDLPNTILNTNYNGNTTNNQIDCLILTTARLGELNSEAKYFHISGVAATYNLKYGAGKLHRIVFNNTSGTSVTIYDNTIAAAPIVGIITTTAGQASMEYDVAFNTGLTIVTLGNNLDATVIYE